MKILSIGFCYLSFVAVIFSAVSDKPIVKNLPESFYERSGLEKMTRIDYESMPVVNVKDMGAKGDGVTDEKQFFVKALKILKKKGGGVIYVPKGIYVFDTIEEGMDCYWYLPSSVGGEDNIFNIHFVGDGEETIIRFKQKDGVGYPKGWDFGDAAKDITIRDMSFTFFPFFDRRSANHPGWVGSVVEWGTWDPEIFNKNAPQNIYYIGVNIDISAVGIWMRKNVRNIWIVDCFVRNTCADGIHLDGSKNAVVAYNYIENTGDDGIAVISCDYYSNPLEITENVSIIKNTVYNSKYARGITIGGNDSHVIGNWVERTACPGLHLHPWGHGGKGTVVKNAIVTDNTFVRTDLSDCFGNKGLAGWDGAVKLECKVDGFVFSKNKIYGSSQHGFYVEMGGISSEYYPSNWTINEVTLNDNRIEGCLGYGVYLGKSIPINGLDLENNIIQNNNKGDVKIESKINKPQFNNNLISTSPDIVSDVSKKVLSGLKVQSEEKKEYNDRYLVKRTAKNETDWKIDANETVIKSKDVKEVNVFDYGAVGDGKTNCIKAFQRAVDAISDEGGVLVVPEGEYFFDSTEETNSLPFTRINHHLLIADKKNIHIIGQGKKTVFVFKNVNSSGIRFINTEDFSLKNIVLKLQRKPVLRHNRALLDISACKNAVIQDLLIYDSAGPGILLDVSDNIVAKNNNIQSSGTYGIYVCGSRQIELQNNIIIKSRDSGIAITGNGSIFREPQYIRIFENDIFDVLEGYGIGVLSGNNVEIKNNHVYATYLAGISIYTTVGHFPPQFVTLSENKIFSCNNGEMSYTKGAISVFGLLKGDIGESIFIERNKIFETKNFGIWVDTSKCDKLLIRDNIVDAKEGVLSISEEQKKKITNLILD